MKVCTGCSIEKPLESFVKRKTTASGYGARCKECVNSKIKKPWPARLCANSACRQKLNRGQKKFCSHSCSAKVSNSISVRMPTAHPCSCGKAKDKRAIKCSTCTQEEKDSIYRLSKIEDWVYANPTTPQSLYGRIRLDARTRTKTLPRKCLVCGYSNHVQVAHIRAISDFPRDTLVSVVNGFDNLSLLCPNHHWEFDHGLLIQVPSIESIKPY